MVRIFDTTVVDDLSLLDGVVLFYFFSFGYLYF